MTKIFGYELRRMILNKFYIGLLIINGVYAWYALTTETIAGVADTAPFSPWSFGAYLARVMPVSILTVLFLLTLYHTKNERQVGVLTAATPVDPIRYALVRVGAIAVCFLMISVLVVGLGLYFYISVFAYRDFHAFALPTLMILLPCFVFAIGAGYSAGRIHPGLLYALMLAALIVGFIGIGGNFDFFGGGYFSQYPRSLPVGADGEPAFTVGMGFWLARLVYLAAGGVLLAIGIGSSRKKPRKA